LVTGTQAAVYAALGVTEHTNTEIGRRIPRGTKQSGGEQPEQQQGIQRLLGGGDMIPRLRSLRLGADSSAGMTGAVLGQRGGFTKLGRPSSPRSALFALSTAYSMKRGTGSRNRGPEAEAATAAGESFGVATILMTIEIGRLRQGRCGHRHCRPRPPRLCSLLFL